MPKAAIPHRRKRKETEEEALASVAVVNRQEILHEVKLKRENSQWLDEHREEMRRKYPDRYVAVFDKKVVAHSDRFEVVLSALRKKSESAPAIAAIEFISEDELIWAL